MRSCTNTFSSLIFKAFIEAMLRYYHKAFLCFCFHKQSCSYSLNFEVFFSKASAVYGEMCFFIAICIRHANKQMNSRLKNIAFINYLVVSMSNRACQTYLSLEKYHQLKPREGGFKNMYSGFYLDILKTKFDIFLQNFIYVNIKDRH